MEEVNTIAEALMECFAIDDHTLYQPYARHVYERLLELEKSRVKQIETVIKDGEIVGYMMRCPNTGNWKVCNKKPQQLFGKDIYRTRMHARAALGAV